MTINICLLISSQNGINLYKYLTEKNNIVKLIIWIKGIEIIEDDDKKTISNNKTELLEIRKFQIKDFEIQNIIIEKFISNKISLGITYYFDILPSKIFNMNKKVFFVNIHYSLLYSYCGSTPVEWQIYNKEKFIGVTIHEITDKVDRGRIILQNKILMPYKIFIFKNLYNQVEIMILELINIIDNNINYNKEIKFIDSEYEYSYYPKFNKSKLLLLFK